MKDEQKTGEITLRQSCIDVSTKIEERIFTVRGKQVMIDKDLALLYGVETKIMRTFTQIRKSIYRAYMPNAVSAEHTVIVLANHTCQAYRQPRNRGLAKKCAFFLAADDKLWLASKK